MAPGELEMNIFTPCGQEASADFWVDFLDFLVLLDFQMENVLSPVKIRTASQGLPKAPEEPPGLVLECRFC